MKLFHLWEAVVQRLPALGSLRAFEAAARHASFKRAAAELGVTPTAVSHQIRQLEEEVGQRLFVRRTRAVALTPAGQALFGPVGDAFRLMAEGVATVRRRPLRQVATLSATSAFTARLLVPQAVRFRDLHENWDLRLHASDEVVDLKAGEADAAIRYGYEDSPGLTAVPLFADLYAPICSPHLGLRSVADLSSFALIHFDWRFATAKAALPTWRLWLERAGIASIDPESGIAFNDESAAIQSAIAGQGIALLSLALVAPELASGALIQPFGPTLDGRRYDLVFPSHAAADAPIIALQRWLEEIFGQKMGVAPAMTALPVSG